MLFNCYMGKNGYDPLKSEDELLPYGVLTGPADQHPADVMTIKTFNTMRLRRVS